MSNHVTIKSIAFDLGKVLFDFDYAIALEAIKNTMRSSTTEVIDAIFNEDYGLDFEKGLCSAFEFYRGFTKRFGNSFSYDEFVFVLVSSVESQVSYYLKNE